MFLQRLCCVLIIAAPVSIATADTVLYDFEDGTQGWRSFGPITTDSSFSSGTKLGSLGFGYFHTGDFDADGWGMVDVSPETGPLRDLSAFQGLSVDALFQDVFGYPSFDGVKALHMVVATGFGASEEEFFAPPVILTDFFDTYSFAFADFQSTLTFLPPTTSDLSDVTIKLVMYNEDGTGTGELIYDEITGLDAIAPTNNADFDGDQLVDGADFLIWQRNFGTGTMQNQGDANNNGTVDGFDLSIWQTQFGSSTNSVPTTFVAVPEPGALIMSLLAATFVLSTRRR